MDKVREERLARQAAIVNRSMQLEERRAIAVSEKLALMKSIGAEVLLTKPSEMKASGSLMSWMERYLKDDDGAVARGQALTQVLWVPAPWRYAMIEYLKGEGAYSQQGAGFVCTLKNVAAVPLKVDYKYTERSTPVANANIGWVDGPTYEGVVHKKPLAPGATITLAPHFAITNLRRHSFVAHDPVLWGTAAVPEYEGLVEVSYRCVNITDEGGEPLDSERLRAKAREAAASDEAPRRRNREAA
jgi:hypothetical protein